MRFTNVIKPTHLCNLACSYCFNEDERRGVMPNHVADRVVSETFQYASSGGADCIVDFTWHGGEPTLAGLGFFRDVVAIQRRAHQGLRYQNFFQTNGILLDQGWIEFLAGEGFHVSLSIDGPPAIHDAVRRTRTGSGSHAAVMQAIERLRAAGVDFGVCVVVSRLTLGHEDDVFDFLSREQLPFNVIPLNNSGAARTRHRELGIQPRQYGEAWIALFDRWFYASGRQYVPGSDFIRKAWSVMHGRPTSCTGHENCASGTVSTDPAGWVYPCASLTGDPGWRYGNVRDSSLAEMMASPAARAATSRGDDPACTPCRWRPICHGGCMARAAKFSGDFRARDYYCPSLRMIFNHVDKRLRGDPDVPYSRFAPPLDPVPADCDGGVRAS